MKADEPNEYEEQFKKCFTELSKCAGFCENCGFVILEEDGWRDIEKRLCFECCEYESEPSSTPYSSSDEYIDSDIDDPTWLPPAWLKMENVGETSPSASDTDDDESDYDEPVSGEVDSVGSF